MFLCESAGGHSPLFRLGDIDACAAAVASLRAAVQGAVELANHAVSRGILLTHSFATPDDGDAPIHEIARTTAKEEVESTDVSASEYEEKSNESPATAYGLFKRSLQNLFDSLDHDGNGFISQREFVDATRMSMALQVSNHAVKSDQPMNHELKEWYTRCGFDLDSVCFEDLDRNGDGEIRSAPCKMHACTW